MNTEPQTPRTDALAHRLSQSPEQSVRSYPTAWEQLSSQLETELSTANARIVELEQALSGRTVSCAACNASSAERDRWMECAEMLKRAAEYITNNGYAELPLSSEYETDARYTWPKRIANCKDQLEAALAEYSRCAEGVATSEWRDIATAPKDGTPFWGCHKSYYPESIRLVQKALLNDESWTECRALTHWMPLPQPPQPTDV